MSCEEDNNVKKDEIVPLEDIDTEWEAEKICRWGAARSSVARRATL